MPGPPTATLIGPQSWKMTRDTEGHREYKVMFLVALSDKRYGPYTALKCPGLPLPGAWYVLDFDIDVWAWCRPNAEVNPRPSKANDPNTYFTVEITFATKPPEWKKQRCQNNEITDPLLEPQKLTGGTIKYTEEATHDRHGKALLTSSWEVIRGPQVEFDKCRSKVTVEQNVAFLNLLLCEQIKNCVNDAPLWGLPARCIKLTDFNWERKYYGQCSVYYTRHFEFETYAKQSNAADLQAVSGFDRDITDEGTKVLNGHWDNLSGKYVTDNIGGAAPDPLNPAHFRRFKDRFGENGKVILDGHGLPIDAEGTGTGTGTPGNVHVEYYNEADFTRLNIPIDLAFI